MRRQQTIVRIAALFTLGSGFVNLLSVIGPSLPARVARLERVFPIEFIHLTRFLTLLLGFSLVVLSVNIYRRKKRAFRLVAVLALLSAVLHLTKGIDYEEASLSAALFGLLLYARSAFVVESSIPSPRWAAVRFVFAAAAVLFYGIAGFWLLEPREFGINFHLADAVHRTFRQLTFLGNADLIPRTRYAVWFLDSLDLISIAAIIYALGALFRPVLYRYRTLPHERKEAEQLVARHGRCALDFFKFGPDKTFFFSPAGDCFLAYKVAAGYAMVLGDPVGPPEAIEPIVRTFMAYCDQNDWRTAFHQTLPDFLPIYRKLGFRRLKIGDDAVVDLPAFTLHGKDGKKFRTKLNQMEKLGARFAEYPPPLDDETLARAREVSDAWLTIPGRRERAFTLGQFDPDYLRSTHLAAAFDSNGVMQAFVNLVPSHTPDEATIDLMRHRPDALPGVMDYVFTMLLLSLKERGVARFGMGMAPMAGFHEKEEASMEERAVHHFIQRLNFLFSYQGLRHFKAKYATRWEPRYLVYRHILNLPRVARAIALVSQVGDDEIPD